MNQVFDVGPGARLSVRLQAGRIDLTNGPSEQIRIEAISKHPEEDVEISQAGDTVSIVDNRNGWVVRGNVRIVAEVPVGCDLDIRAASATIDVDGSVGSFSAKTASGNVDFRSAAELEVKTASGTVRGEEVLGSARVTSASGDVRIEHVRRAASVGVASGNVGLEDVDGDVRISSASGNIRVERFHGDDASLKTVSGNLAIGFPRGISLEADIATLTGSVRLPESPTDERSDPWEPDSPTGRRKVRFAAKSVSGSIRVTTFSD